jgi:hypothetical protein
MENHLSRSAKFTLRTFCIAQGDRTALCAYLHAWIHHAHRLSYDMLQIIAQQYLQDHTGE